MRSIVDALDAPPPSRHELLGVAHRALPGAGAQSAVSDDVARLLEDLDWHVWADGPLLGALSLAVDTARACGVPLDRATLRRYAEAMRAAAEVDVDLALAATSPAEALQTVVLGTVLLDPVLLALRRVAQEAASAGREPGD